MGDMRWLCPVSLPLPTHPDPALQPYLHQVYEPQESLLECARGRAEGNKHKSKNQGRCRTNERAEEIPALPHPQTPLQNPHPAASRAAGKTGVSPSCTRCWAGSSSRG